MATTIIGLYGSLRRASFNLMLLRAAVEAAPPGTSIEIESIREIPLYDGDVEAEQGVPPAVRRLKDRIAEADGLLIVTPEYNNAIPGPGGTALSQAAWLPVLRTLGTRHGSTSVS